MKKQSILFAFVCFAVILSAQQAIQLGKGSYAEYPPEAAAYEDGYFAAPYNWFQQAWPDLNLHENVRNRPLPTNHWWTAFIFRGLGKVQETYGKPPVTVTTTGNRFGCEAWAYPYMATATAQGFNVFYPKGFSGNGMNKGNPLKINASTVLQANDESIVFADFESVTWPTGWVATNNTHNIPGPRSASEVTSTPKGYVGERFFSSAGTNAAKITLTSPLFTIEKKYIRLYVGGGNYPEDTYVGLFINGIKVLSETGLQSATVTQRTWDVTAYKDQQAEIRIVDNSTAGWGYTMCDEIIFTDRQSGGSGYTPDFETTAAKVYDWTDLGFTLKSEDGQNYMNATMIHGVPFVYVELNGLYPILAPGNTASVYDATGNQITEFPISINAFTIEFDNRVYGVHAPLGSKIHQSNGGDFLIETPINKRYVVISILPDRTLLTTYDQYARNKPGNILFNYEYKVSEGKIVTTFEMDAKSLETGIAGQQTLMSFLPHHYRTTTQNFNFITGAEYQMFIGKMKTGAGQSFSLTYNFGGMPPYLPEPLDMTPERKEMMNNLLSYSSTHFGRNGNTYAKGLGEQTTMMLMAKELNHPGFDLFKVGLKNEFVDWFTFDESEKTKKQYYFAQYPNYGAVIGFTPGYGSQGFNDLHFHNGYFTVGAARLMMADKEFKRDYSEMAKLITKTYANWEHYKTLTDTYIPFLRTFDPYLGHSFAGGTGDGGGNNQESTSEAINSWFGTYMLGVELNDKAIIDCGAMGYLLEMTAAGEYWLNLYGDNFSPTYTHQYVGIKRTDNLAWATYFAGDPAWVLGIQACPVDFYYGDFGLKPEAMKNVQQAMFNDRTTFLNAGVPMHPNNDPYDNIKTMGPYIGGYHLNIMNYIDPETAALWIDEFCNDPVDGQTWRNHLNTTTNYYLSNAMVTYGNPAPGYHTSIPSGAVYKNKKGELTYLLYNPTENNVDVNIYKDGAIIETIHVGAGKYYNSRISGTQKPSVTILGLKNGDKIASNKNIEITASASDKNGRIISVDFYFNNVLVGTSYAKPFGISFIPGAFSNAVDLKAIATNDEGNQSEPYIVSLTTVAQTPFKGTPWNVPQETIYAVQFDEGGAEIACHDNEIEMKGGDNYRLGTGVETQGTKTITTSNIGWSNTGEWFEYTIYVQSDGVYAMTARLASNTGGALRIFIDNKDMAGSVPIAKGSNLNLYDLPIANIPLNAGKHIMRVMFAERGANLNAYTFVLTTNYLPSEVSAGNDLVILDPAHSTTLNATAITYGNTSILKYEWTQIDSNTPVNIVSPSQATTNISGLQLGTYIFQVKITDSNEVTATDNVVVLVKPQNFAPLANAGNDRTIHTGEELILDGSNSEAINGTIIKYEWLQVDSNAPVTIQQNSPLSPTATVSGFQAENLYIFKLIVTNSQNKTGSANVRIFIAGTANVNEMYNPEIEISPNPFTDRINIAINENIKFEKIRLYSVTGNVVLEENIGDRSVVQLNTAELKRGYYILTLFSKEGVISRKVVK